MAAEEDQKAFLRFRAFKLSRTVIVVGAGSQDGGESQRVPEGPNIPTALVS